MKTFLFSLSLVMIAFTLICGFWIKAQDKIEKSSVNFHMGLALITMVIVIGTMIYLWKK